ncbi:Type II inositol 3,4-bisphosphate 4-phosphatase [Sciurus carolinensis]|uniref:Type II inositol 3,4-bisphosphate 4-phosphatase n=2 Tax=Euarchontoglires TaxID=314146 RepID=A0AA41MCR1_SCICA|nr:Type II inositol 3,4-bisphosphate 4-phosphatase [Sciurus carolinensis]
MNSGCSGLQPPFLLIAWIQNSLTWEVLLNSGAPKACKDLVAPVRDRKLNTVVQISVIHPAEQSLIRYSSTEIVEGTRDPLFLTGVTFPSEYPIYEETKIKLTVYDVKDKSHDTDSSRSVQKCPECDRKFTLFISLPSKPQVVRTSDGGKVVGTIEVSVVKMGEIEDGEADHITTDVQGQKCALVYECTAPESVSGKDNLPFLNAVLKNPVCKLYRFPTSDNKWMRIREQMSESILSFHIPKELISLHIKEDLCRNQELKELGELSPHWDNLRKNVLTHCDQMVNMYQDILTELSKDTGSSFKSSSSKGEKTLEFVPVNLHLQRMHVHSPHLKDAVYDVITVGAPAAHFQGFKNGGLRKLLHRFETERRKSLLSIHSLAPNLSAIESGLITLLKWGGEGRVPARDSADEGHLLITSWVIEVSPKLRLHEEGKLSKWKYAVYDVITVGAPAAHFQGFKNGGLRKLLHRFETERRNTGYQFIYYSPENTAKAKEVLSNINQLQPLIATHADLLLNSASQRSPDSLKNSLKMLSEKTELFVHAFKDQLVRSALLALYTARPGGILTKPPSPRSKAEESSPQDQPPRMRRQDSIPHHSDYDEEEWDRVWANVGKSLNCIIAMVDKLIERDGGSEGYSGGSKDGEKDSSLEDSITSHPSEDWCEQLRPLVLALKDCMGEVVSRAKQSLTFVLLQELACSLPQCLTLTLRRDVVFSQALAGLVCGFIIKLHTSLHDPNFLQQLHTVGLIVQYEGLLSTYSDEIGMLEDMAVGISDLKKVAFKIIEAKSNDVLPVITGRREHYVVEVKLPAGMFESLPAQIKEGQLLHVHPVLFNVGINEQQTLAERFGDVSLQESINHENFELLKEYYTIFMEKMPPDYISHFQEQTDLKGLLENLHQNIQAKKRKNVEIVWLAATICRKLNGIRFTCCKSAKDRTSMSVTLEQCSILRDEHQLHKDFFIRALDCMRRYPMCLEVFSSFKVILSFVFFCFVLFCFVSSEKHVSYWRTKHLVTPLYSHGF